MIRSSAIRLITIAAAAAAAAALTGCAAGVNAQTTKPFNTTDGASANFHNIAIRNLFVLGPPSGGTLSPGQRASLFGAFVNSGTADQLAAVSAPGTASSVTIKGGALRLSPGQAALLTGPSPQMVLVGLTRPLEGGQNIPVTLVFQNAGAVTLNVPVMARRDYYATYLPPPIASPAPSASGKGRSKKASPSPSGASSASATPSPGTTP